MADERADVLSLTDQLEATRTTLTIAHASYQIWWTYAEKNSRKQHWAGIQALDRFVRFDELAHLWILVLQLRTLFDKRADTIRLSDLIKQCLPGNLAAQLLRRVENLDAEREKIEVLRHKLIAHRDNTLYYNDVYKLASISHDVIKLVLDEAVDIFGILAEKAGLPRFDPFPVADQVGAMLNCAAEVAAKDEWFPGLDVDHE
jgi:hypothetical protein